MAKDFRSKQIRTSKLIGSGGIAAGTPFLGLAIYDHRHAVNNAGTQKYDGTLEPKMLNDVGRDVWMFVSGAKSHPQYDYYSKIGGSPAGSFHRMLTGSDPGRPVRSIEDDFHGGKVVLFGGDVVISGTLYAERQVMEVDEQVRGDLIVPHRAHISESMHVSQGAVFNIAKGGTAYSEISGIPVPGHDFTIHGDTVDHVFFVDASTNRIGIGDSAPESFFNIKSTTTDALTDVGAPANYHLRLEGSETTNKGTGLAFGGDNEIGASIIYKVKGSKSKGELQFYTKDSTSNDADPEQRMVITSDGRVGIGEAEDSYDFDPAGLLEIMGDGDYGPHLQLSNNAADYAKFDVGTHGDLTITTVDAAAGAANFVVVADGAVDIDANAGALSLDGSTGINIGTEADVAIDIDSSTFDLDASGAITIDGTSTLSIDSADDSNVTVTGAGKNLTLSVAGGNAQRLELTSAGTGARAVDITTTAGGVDVDANGILALDSETRIDIGVATDVPVDIDSSTLDIDASGAITIDTSGGASHIAITSAHTAGDAITISANADAGSILNIDAGIMDVDVQGAYTLDASGVSIDSDAASNFSTSAGDITIDAAAASLNLLGGEADAAAVRIQADNAAGGIDIDAGTAGVHVDTTGAISLDSTYNNAAAINITTNAGTSEKIVIQNTQGNTEAAAADGAIKLDASAGGISLDAALDIHLAADGGDIAFSDGTTTVMNFDVDNVAFKMMDDADTGDYFEIATAAAGATTITTVDDDAGAANLTFVIDGAVDIDANSGALNLDGSAGINIGTETDVAVTIDADTFDIDASGASTFNSTSTIVVSANGGVTLRDDTEGLAYDGSGNVDFDAVALDVDASGAITIDGASTLSIDSADDSNVTVTGSGKHLTLSTAGGGAQRLELTSAGTGARAIDVTATAGGFDVDANGILALDSETRIDIGVAQDVPLDIDSSTLDIDASGAITIDGSSTISIDGAGALNIDTSSGALSVGTANSGIAVNIGHSTSEVTVGDNLTVQGNLTVNGVTTTVNSTTMTVDDPILTLGGDSAPGSDDNKDRGVEFRWHDGSNAKVGFFGFDDSTKEFTFVPEATNSSEVFSGEKGIINVQGVNFANDGALYGDAGSLRVTVPSGGDLVLSQSIGLVFGNAGEKIEGDGTNLTIQGGDINLTAESDVNIPANIGLTFGDDGEKIEGNGTKLVIASSEDIDLTATTDINIPANVGLTFGDDGEKIEGDGSGLTIQAGTISLDSEGDIILDSAGQNVYFREGGSNRLKVNLASSKVQISPQVNLQDIQFNYKSSGGAIYEIGRFDSGEESFKMATDKKIQFGDTAEFIVGDGTDLSISSSGKLLLTASSDIVIPANVGIWLDGVGDEKIESDGTDINFSVGSGGDINIPANIGLTFGNDGEVIEGDGSGLSVKGGSITLDSEGDIKLDAAGADIDFLRNGVLNARMNLLRDTTGAKNPGLDFEAKGFFMIRPESGEVIFASGSSDTNHFGKIQGLNNDMYLSASVSNKDMIFMVNDGGTMTEVMRLDGDVSALKIAASKQLQLGAAEEHIYGDGTDIHFGVGAGGDINIPANIGLTFGDDGEKIEGDGTDLTIAGNNINLTATEDIVVPANVGITFGTGEKIEGDNTDLTVTSGGDIKLSAAAQVQIPANVPLTLDGTGGSDTISSDGTDMVIAAGGGDITLDAANDIKLDAAGSDIDFLRNGVLNARLNLMRSSTGAKNEGIDFESKGFLMLRPESGEVVFSSGSAFPGSYGKIQGLNSDMYLSASVSNKDMIFMVNDGGTMTEVMRLDGDVSALKVAAGKQVQFGNANVSLSNSTVSGKENDLTLASHLLNVTSEETYYTGDVFVSGTFTPSALSLNNLDLAANGYLRFGDANNFIQRSGNDLQFRDTNTGATKTLTDLMSASGIGPFEVLSNAGVSPATLKMRSTGSFSLGANNQYADVVGSDLFFFISGSVDRGSASDTKASAFGGDVVITGSLKAGAKIDTWSYSGGNHFYSLSASMEEVGFQAPLVGKNTIGSDVLSILPGYDINKAANNSLVSILGEVSDGNIIFGVNDGGTATEVMRLQGNNASLRMNASKNLEFGGTSRYINSANTTAINYVNSNTAGAHVFTGHIRPAANNTYDLGAETLRFRNIYTGDLNLKNERGDWTILEEEDYLCVINNKTGKKFKMMLEPIEENE